MIRTQTAPISVAASTDQTIIPARADNRIAVVGYTILNGVDTGNSFIWKSGSTPLTGQCALALSVGSGVVNNGAGVDQPVLDVVEGQALVLKMSANTAVAGHVTYAYIPVR